MTDRQTPPFGKPLYRTGRGDDLASLMAPPILGVLIGTFVTFKVGLLTGLIVGVLFTAVILVLNLIDRGRRTGRSDSDGGGGDGGIFDGSSTRHFDACHSDGADGGGDGGDGGGDGGD